MKKRKELQWRGAEAKYLIVYDEQMVSFFAAAIGFHVAFNILLKETVAATNHHTILLCCSTIVLLYFWLQYW